MEPSQSGYAQRCSDLQNAFNDFDTNDDRILLIENVLGKNLDDTGKDGNTEHIIKREK
jgi:hypothetical protein